MEYVIYTYGGGDLLISIFNAVAMIFKSDSTYLTPVGQIAMGLGVIFAGVKATYKGDIALLGRGFFIPSTIVFLVLFSPKTTIWIKDEVALTAPVKIDNIPFGISFFASIGSVTAHNLSKLMEETMLPAESNGSTNTGLLYGAKAVVKIRDIQIQDPTLLRNTKEYLRQCYMKPYVMGNFGGHKAEAIRSTDLLTFLNANPAKCFGIKPANRDGSAGQFMTCTEAGKMIQKEIVAESKSPGLMKQFGAAIGISTRDEALMTKRIKAMTSDVFTQLEQGHTDMNEWVQQAMMLNANRESYDDLRESYDQPRVYPELVRMQATRGLFQQSLGSIIGGEMSKAMIPTTVQPTVFGLLVMLFVIILPFTLLPGGWSYAIIAIKLIIWVCSWPVFYTIIHAIGMILIKDAISGWGEDGLSLIGQAGFTQLIMMQYATAQSLVSAVPVISFAIVFGSPYALSSIASGIASVSAAMPLGSAMADGSVAMRQISYNNASKHQQQLAPVLSMGSVFDDGSIRQTSSQDGKSTALVEQQDQLMTNHVSTDGDSASINESLNNAKSKLASITDRENTVTTIGKTQGMDWAKSFVNGTVISDNVSKTDVEAYKNAFSTNDTTKTGTNVVDSQATGTNAHVDLKIPPAVTAVTGIGGGTGTTASNNHEIRKDMSAEEMQQYNTAIEHMKSAAKTGNFTTNNAADQKLGESYGANLMEQEQIARDKVKAEQQVQTYTTQASYVASNSGTITQNRNDAYFKEVMSRHPELATKPQVLNWAKTHQQEAAAIGRDVSFSDNILESPDYKAYAARITKNTPSVENTQIATPDSLKSRYQKSAANVEKQAVARDVTGAIKPIKEVVSNAVKNSNLGYNKSTGDILRNNLNAEELADVQKLENERVRGDDSKSGDIAEDIKKGKKDFDSPMGKSTIYRAVEQAGYNAGLSDRAIDEKNIIMPGYKDKDEK